MKNLTLGLCAALLLAGCAPATVSVSTATNQPVPTFAPTQTAYPTYTPAATVIATQLVTVEVTRIVNQVITATSLPASPTSAATDTPAPTDTAVPTANAKTATAEALGPLIADRADGNYLVNVDIAPGIWRNDGSASDGTNCYWKRLTKTNSIIDNYLGAGNGTMFVAASDFAVLMENCGNWKYIGQ